MNEAAQPEKPNRLRTIAAAVILAFVLLATLIIVLDWHQVREILGKAEWRMSLLALLFTIVSYLCLSSGYALINRVFGMHISWKQLLGVGLVSTTMNNLMALFGAPGHSLRLALIKRKEIETGQIIAASIFHSYLHNVMMLVMIFFGLILVLAGHIVSGAEEMNFGLAAGLLLLTLAASTAILLVTPVRRALFGAIIWLWRLVTRHDISKLFYNFNMALSIGTLALRNQPWKLVLLLGLMIGEWAFAAVALGFCFAALGGTIGTGALLSGFGFGVAVGDVSMIPAGIGVQEASMAGVYSILGTPFAEALLAAILFRVIYEFIPFLLSLTLYGWLWGKTK